MAPIKRVADRLEKPALDDRSYRVIELPNKLEALLVHDPETDKASASVSVNVGSFSDADDMPGMAHAVEHLLFMGTEKYPKENAYNQYLTAHSGNSNAYTASTQTNYFFELSTSSEAAKGDSLPLYGALDRFAQFFISPLFLSSTLDRELKAVDSENKKNLQSDQWRLAQLDKSLSNQKHPYHHFSTGNLETLRDEPRKRGVDIRKEFIAFHDKHYSANRMKLVVLGKEPLDQLEEWVGELFAGVHNKDLPQNRWDGIEPYSKKELMTQVFAKPVMDQRMLEIHFPYEDEEEMYETQPSRYLAHLIGHEGPGSILAYIKAKGWANGLSAGPSSVCPGSAFFGITIKLTEHGLEVYQEVATVVFEYIALLKETPPQKWIVDEVKGMTEVDFKFQEKTPASQFTSRMSSVMQKPLPREWLLSGLDLIRKFDAEAITKALTYLRPDNFRLTLVSQDFPGDWNKKEKWYGTEYKMEPFDAALVKSLQEASQTTSKNRTPELHLPHPNEFIPSRLNVDKKEVAEPLKTPRIIRNDELIRTWWKKDDQFWVPRGNVNLTLRNHLASATPANAVKSRLFCELVKDALVEYSYDAEIAGLDYELNSYYIGLGVDVGGYNDKTSVLLEKVLVSMRDLEVKPDRFKIVKERMLRGYKNYVFQQPYRQVGDFTQWLGSDKGYINDHLLAELGPITPEDISTFYPQLLSQMHIEILCHGNIYKEDALRISSLVEKTLKPRPLPEAQWQVRRNLIYPPGSDYTLSRPLGDPANVNHCIEYYLSIGSATDRTLKAKLLLLAQLTDEIGFDQLRTKEQLGYIVWTGAKLNASTMGYRVIIQSERSTTYLEERINAFLAFFGKSLQEMSDEEFDGHKKSVINKRLEKIKNLDQETSRFWAHISSEYFDFLQREHEVEYLKPLSKSDMLDFFNFYIHPTSPHRAKLSVHMIAQASPKSIAGSMTPAEQKEKLIDMIAKMLTSMGVDANPNALTTHFKDIDLTTSGGVDPARITEAMLAYLHDTGAVPDDQVDEIREQGGQFFATVLPSIGVEVAPSSGTDVSGGGAVDGEGEKEKEEPLPEVPPGIRETVPITNVRDWKASLEVSAGPRPVVPLSEFEEAEPKL